MCGVDKDRVNLAVLLVNATLQHIACANGQRSVRFRGGGATHLFVRDAIVLKRFICEQDEVVAKRPDASVSCLERLERLLSRSLADEVIDVVME